MKRVTKVLLAILSGVLLSPAFFYWGTGFMIFIGLIPLLLIEDDLYKQKDKYKSGHIIGYATITFVIFNLLTVWWVKNSVMIGVVAALIINSLFMVTPFTLFHIVKRNLGPRLGYLSLIVLWISFEFIFLNVQVNFPWVILGNAFAKDVAFIQWYDVTGALGGSLWILIMNVLLFKVLQGFRENRSFQANKSKLSWMLGFLIVPIIISLLRFYTYEEDHRPYEVAVLQPNIDPYMKFVDMPQEQQTAYLLDLADSIVTPETDYILGPETFINNSVWHHSMNRHPELRKLYTFLDKHPNADLVIGAMTYKRYAEGDSLSKTAKPLGKSGAYYDSFNSALQMDTSRVFQMYHKSKLVTGAEWMPNLEHFKLLNKLTVDLGGITRSHGMMEHRSVFTSPQSGLKVAPVICWESIFGEYVTEYVRDEGAEMIFILTNDGWWKDTPGHRQHNDFAHIRAIETRRSIARSANTGISSLINQKGQEIERIGWWKRSAISAELNANDHLTFYVKHGDYIARVSLFLSVILLLVGFVKKRSKKA